MVRIVEISIRRHTIEDGILDCLPYVADEEWRELGQEWKKEISNTTPFYASWTNKKAMKQVVRKVVTFWRKRGFKIVWSKEEEGVNLEWEVSGSSRSREDWEVIWREAVTVLTEGMEIEVKGRKFLVLFL